MGASGPKTPGLKFSAMLAGGRTHDAGRSCVSVRRSVQAVRGFVICQRPRVGSRAVIPSPRLSARLWPKTCLWAVLRQVGQLPHSWVRPTHVTSATTRPANLAPRPRRARAFDDARGGLPVSETSQWAQTKARPVFRWRSLRRASNRERGERNGGSHVEVNSF